jgi:hypothetical protein
LPTAAKETETGRLGNPFSESWISNRASGYVDNCFFPTNFVVVVKAEAMNKPL